MSGKIVRYEFLGSYVLASIGCILIDEELENPSEFLEQHKKKQPRRWTLP
jgi:hypothetical protein